MQIDRHNYEEFFLLYADNELGMEQKREVEQFAASNPDLAEELNILLQSRLTPDHTIVFENKEHLMKKESHSPINLANYEGYLLSCVDKELNDDEMAALESFLVAHPRIKDELVILQKIKLQADESIVFPAKESLYRKEEPVRKAPLIIRMNFWKLAVAAVLILLLGIGAFTIFFKNKYAESNTTAAVPRPADQSSNKNNALAGTREEHPATRAGITGNNPKDLTTINSGIQKTTPQIAKKENTGIQQKVNKSDLARNVKPVTANNSLANINRDDLNISKTNTGQREKDGGKVEIPVNNTVSNNLPNQNIAANTVTNNSSQTYNEETASVTTPAETGAVFASQVEGRNRKLRGFFRKATRVFARTTGIGSSGKDEQLLIGGLAVKL